MAKYLILFNLTGETVSRFVAKPSDRAAVVRALAASVGGSLECYYWMFGQYDGFAILEVPDSKTAGAIALAISSTGAFAVQTHELIAPGALGGILSRSKELRAHYKAPGK